MNYFKQIKSSKLSLGLVFIAAIILMGSAYLEFFKEKPAFVEKQKHIKYKMIFTMPSKYLENFNELKPSAELSLQKVTEDGSRCRIQISGIFLAQKQAKNMAIGLLDFSDEHKVLMEWILEKRKKGLILTSVKKSLYQEVCTLEPKVIYGKV